MNVAVTAQGQELSSALDKRFGRAQWIMVVDLDSKDYHAYENTANLNMAQGAGIQTAKRVIDLGVDAVLTGNVGPKAFATLKAAEVQIFLADAPTVSDAIDALNKGELTSVSQANVDGHWS
jgi:predicted Fe-Mo cluster-binding NifX family protein